MPEYGLILLGLLLLTIFLHWRSQVKIFKSKKQLLVLYAVILGVGIIWDQLAISRGHWSFNKEFLLGPRLGLMPIEEYGFAIILPYFGLVVYKIIEKYLKS
jgi:lycopene cyclase domain-containing protein